MKKIALILAAIALAACQSAGPNVQSIEATIDRVCPPVKAVLLVLENSPTVDADLRVQLKEVEPTVSLVCSGEIKPDAINLQALSSQALPVILKVVSASKLDDDQKNYAILSIAVAQAVIESTR